MARMVFLPMRLTKAANVSVPWRSAAKRDVRRFTISGTRFEVIFVDEPDAIINPLGIKGLGEIVIVGVPAAIANAVFHATGLRVRDLPITPDKLL